MKGKFAHLVKKAGKFFPPKGGFSVYFKYMFDNINVIFSLKTCTRYHNNSYLCDS